MEEKEEIMLVIHHYMEDETYIYDTIEEMLKDWNYKDLKTFFKYYTNAKLYKVKEIITYGRIGRKTKQKI